MKEESKSMIETAMHLALLAIEGAPLRKDLEETPRRVTLAYEEMLDGYDIDIESLLSRTFEDEGRDQLVIVKNIESWSLCEHHLLPFHITASVGYLPVGKVLGVSKIERLVHAYAHRLQLQERLTRQIGEDLMRYLEPQGVGIIIKGDHLCMKIRGVKNKSSTVVTSVMLGAFREDPVLRSEFLSVGGR